MNEENLKNWAAFVEYVAMYYQRGGDDIEISGELSGKSVEWLGRITDIKIHEHYSPGVAIAMTPESVRLQDGRLLRADHQFLHTSSDTVSSWDECEVGDGVRFRATIGTSARLFPEIEFSEDEHDPEVLLMIGLYDAELLSII